MENNKLTNKEKTNILKKFLKWYIPLISNPWIWVAFIKGLILGGVVMYLIIN